MELKPAKILRKEKNIFWKYRERQVPEPVLKTTKNRKVPVTFLLAVVTGAPLT